MSDDILPQDLGDTGKELIAKFRNENSQLKAAIAKLESKYEGVNPDDYKTLQEQSQNLSKQNQELLQRATSADAQWDFYQKATGKIDPAYIDLAWKSSASDLKIQDGSPMIGDKPIEQAIVDFVTKFPKVAAVSEGSGLSRDTVPAPENKAIVNSADFLANLDGIANGTVTVDAL